MIRDTKILDIHTAISFCGFCGKRTLFKNYIQKSWFCLDCKVEQNIQDEMGFCHRIEKIEWPNA